MTHRILSRTMAVCALLLPAAAAQASITVHTTEAAFLAATSAPGTDSFDDLVVLEDGGFQSPVDRNAGAHGYSASVAEATGANSLFFAVGTPADPWLSTFNPSDTISFYAFSGGVRAIGGLFFASDFDGAFLPGETVVLVATDADGSITETVVNATDTSFRGFVSTGPLTSLTVSVVQTAAFPYPTVNNLVLASAVPDAATHTLLLTGLATLTMFTLRRRKA